MNKIFDNTKHAFSLKSNHQLNKAYFLFKLISYRPLVNIGTALTNFALRYNLPVKGLIKTTVFDHFCGGISENDCVLVIDKMFQKGVSSVLDYSVEGKEEENHFDEAMHKILKIIDFAKEKKSIPFAVFKPTAFGRITLFEKIGSGEALINEEINEWDRVKGRFDIVCKKGHENDIAILIDAEESWMQSAADQLILDLMLKYNKKKPIVFNTLQMYRWDRLDYLKEIHQQAIKDDFYIGLKVVRGAYMEKEAKRAEEKGYKSPICSTKKATDENYDAAIAYLLKNLDRMSIFAGTHNEESCYTLINKMKEKGIEVNDSRIWFSQLYGMSDHISFNLAHKGYNVAKYLPFGPIKEVMPYLIRRAQENTSVEGQTNRELVLIKLERDRRKEKTK